MKKISLFVATALALCSCSPKSEMDVFIDDLMSRMTLQQKLGQLNLPTVKGDVVTGPEVNVDFGYLLKNDQVGAVLNIKGADKVYTLQKFAVDSSSLHIPLIVGMDVIHGYRTQFPVPLALSCSWNPELAYMSARISAREATTQGINWTYNPMVDVSHDPRWGRVVEGNGEDPLLGSDFARAYVRGYQGDLSGAPDQMLACVKHFALYGASDGGLDYTAVDMSRARMFNCYMAPYKAAVDEGVASIMTCFNEVEGVPGAANEFLLQEVLRGKWGFGGFVVADYNAVKEMEVHGLGSAEDVTVRSVNAGLDMDMCSGYFIEYLADCVKAGKVSQKTVDAACRRILEAKYKLGLFDDPYRFCRKEEGDSLLACAEFRKQAREAAGESIVLLKNDTLKSGKALLPLKKDARIALVGPYGDEALNVIGTWNCDGRHCVNVSVLEGLRAASKGNVVFARGANICKDAQSQKLWCGKRFAINYDERGASAMLSEALSAALRSDVIVAALGEPADLSGEGACRTDLRLPDAQRDLLAKMVATGKPVVLLLFAGRPLDLSWEAENVTAIVDAWFPGTEAGNAVADILFGDVNPSAHITMSFPRNVGQLPYYYNHTQSGRPYSGTIKKYISTYFDCVPEPLYPFGYGLSYTSFGYSEPRASVDGRSVHVEFEVTNTGSRPGREVAQLYVRDVAASVARPVCELKGYEKVLLEPGETKTVEFDLSQDDLSFYDNDLRLRFEPGEFLVMCGSNCRDLKSVSVNLE